MTWKEKIDVLYEAYLDTLDSRFWVVHDEKRDTIVFSGSLVECKKALHNRPSLGVLRRSDELELIMGMTKSEYASRKKYIQSMLREATGERPRKKPKK